jgi:hypothetical protein
MEDQTILINLTNRKMKNTDKRDNTVCSEKKKFKNLMRYCALGVIGLTALSFNAKAQCAGNTMFINLTPVSPTCNGGADGAIGIAVIGGNSTYTYNWSTGATTANIIGVAADVYTVTVIDGVGCTKTQSAVISNSGPLVATISGNNIACSVKNGALSVTVVGAAGSLAYNWSNGATSQVTVGLASNYYTVTVTDGTNCAISSAAIVDSCDLVWPGDANRDLVVNNNDLLALGIGYGSTGSARHSRGIFWNGYVANDWGTALANGKDYKNADCDGDGNIIAADTFAIILNYSLTHTLKLAKSEYVNGLPDLTFTIPTDTALSGTTINVPIMLGSSTNQANGVYGLAFSITYDPKIVDATKIGLSLNNSWLGTNGTDLIYITKNFGSMGRLDVGITRIDHQNISGFGKIGDLGITLKDDIALKIAAPIYKTLTIEATQIKAISNNETIIPLNEVPKSVVVQNTAVTGIHKYTANTSVAIYPNPASGSFTVNVNASDVKEMKLTNILGETVWQNTNNTNSKVVVDTQSLPAGTYYLSIITSQDKIVKQVNVIK